jgi:hypothetical protein
MSRTLRAIAAIVLWTACGPSSIEVKTELCQDLTNLQPTVDLLAAPPAGSTTGEVRGALDKVDPTWQAVRDDNDVPDDEDQALLDAQEAYRDAIEGVGDDDPFAPHAAETAASAQALSQAYTAVRARLACPVSPASG